MSTTERMIELDIALPRRTPVQRLAAVLATMRSVWRATRNRILSVSGIADDPSQQLARAARNRARRALQGLPVD